MSLGKGRMEVKNSPQLSENHRRYTTSYIVARSYIVAIKLGHRQRAASLTASSLTSCGDANEMSHRQETIPSPTNRASELVVRQNSLCAATRRVSQLTVRHNSPCVTTRRNASPLVVRHNWPNASQVGVRQESSCATIHRECCYKTRKTVCQKKSSNT
jgi:hypothetical protein